MKEMLKEKLKVETLKKEVDDWKEAHWWIRDKDEDDKSTKELNRIDKEMEEVEYIESKEVNDKIVGKKIDELRVIGRELIVARGVLKKMDVLGDHCFSWMIEKLR